MFDRLLGERGVSQTGKGIGIGILCCLIFSVLFALFWKFFAWGNGVLLPAVCVIKAVGILLGCLLSLRGEKGWIKGIFVGDFTILFSRMIFLFLANFTLSGGYFFLDLLFGGAIGFLSGIIAVNVRG